MFRSLCCLVNNYTSLIFGLNVVVADFVPRSQEMLWLVPFNYWYTMHMFQLCSDSVS